MIEYEDRSATFIGYFSIWKTAGFAILFSAMAILPVTPHFEEGLFYTAFLYKFPFSILRIVASVGCGIFSIMMIKLLTSALAGRPALKIEAGVVYTSGLARREFLINQIQSVIRQSSGNILIKVSNRKGVSIPLFLIKDSERAWESLRKVVEAK